MQKKRSVQKKTGSRGAIRLPLIIQEEDGGYFVECPIFPSCYTQGNTLDEAISNIQEVIDMLLEEEEYQQILKNYNPRTISFHTITI